MSDIELIEIALTEDFPYRKKLNDDVFSFGIEIEMEQIDIKNMERLLNHKIDSTWQQKEDISLLDHNSLELASPILQNSKDIWKQLEKLSKTLKLFNPTFENSSFQVSLDMIQEENLIWLFKFYAIYEKVIYCFSKGDDLSLRACIESYAAPIYFMLECELENKKDEKAIEIFKNRKKYGLNINEIETGTYKNNKVIEFRTPNGTVDAWLWQNYINTFYHIRKYITSKDLDKERINYHFNNIDQTFSDGLYNQLDIESCFEFIHTIFSNDLDKLYFLKQYLKNHEQKVRKYIKEQHIMK